MSDNNYVSGYMGIMGAASAAATGKPDFGLVLDTATGQWHNANEFNTFVRAAAPVLNTKAKADQAALQATLLHSQELQKAQSMEAIGAPISVSPEEAAAWGRAGTLGKDGMIVKKSIGALFGDLKSFGEQMLTNPFNNDTTGPDAYAQYSKHGGLLTQDEFESFSDDTRKYLMAHAQFSDSMKGVGSLPGMHQLGTVLQDAYRGAVTGVDQMGLVPGVGKDWSVSGWEQAWRESEGKSLGNALVNVPLSTAGVSSDTLSRWRRDNPWYQMASVGTEIAATWNLDPLVLGGKSIGAAARFKKGALPLNLNSQTYKAAHQTLMGVPITVANPIPRIAGKAYANRMIRQQEAVEAYARATADSPSMMTRLPMFGNMSRARNGVGAAYALHWAINHEAEAANILNSPEMKAAAEAAGKEYDFTPPANLNVKDLMWGVVKTDPRAIAILKKIENVTPEELKQYAPGAQTLVDAINTATTRADVLQSEIDDLLAHQAKIGKPGDVQGQTTYPEWEHRWEVHTDIAKRQAQKAEIDKALNKYEGYSDWVNLTTGGDSGVLPELNRISGPSGKRWSEVRNKSLDGSRDESHHFFMDNPFGAAHSINKITHRAFAYKASMAEFHNPDSVATSIRRQFDQLNNYFGYDKPGLADEYISRAMKAKNPFEQYKTMWELEETHLPAAIAHKFGVSPEFAAHLMKVIHSKRFETIQGILTGEGKVFDTAPGTATRLADPNDASVSLVSRDPENKTVTVNLIHGRHQQTVTTSEGVLEPRVEPVDPTQTPNYYTPEDHRRLYYLLKHHQEMLRELDQNTFASGSSLAHHATDWIGTNFNNFWKPIQLFRLGWPTRVLMDEGARAIFINGLGYATYGPGARALANGALNKVSIPYRGWQRYKHGTFKESLVGPARTAERIDMPYGPGPLTSGDRGIMGEIKHDVEEARAAYVPESIFPEFDAGRFDKHTALLSELNHLENASRWRHSTHTPFGDLAAARNTGTATPAQERTLDYALSLMGTQERSPLAQKFHEWEQDHLAVLQHRSSGGDRAPAPMRITDTTNFRPNRTGYVVKVQRPEEAGSDPGAFLLKNHQLLSHRRIRVMEDPLDGRLHVVAHFNNTERKQAENMARFVFDSHGYAEMHNVATGEKSLVMAADDPSLIMEANYRQMVREAELERQTGAAPVKGGPEVFHGSYRKDLHEQPLLGKEDVPVVSGRMMGPGLYTTENEGISEAYVTGDGQTYIVKNSRTGKVYKEFDADQPLTEKDLQEFGAWAWSTGFRGDRHGALLAEMRDVLEGRNARGFATATGDKPTWANLYEAMSNSSYEGWEGEMLSNFLESERGVGVIRHQGGTSRGAGHTVRVWLHPEDISLSPLFLPNGKFHTFEQWMMHPNNRFNFIPENRIIRAGKRNPMLADLRQVDRRMIALMRKHGSRVNKVPEWTELTDRESALMEALGLSHRSSADPPLSAQQPHNAHLIPTRYRVDPAMGDHFSRMVNEARTEDEARTLARAANGDLRAQESAAALSPADFDMDWFDASINDPHTNMFNRVRETRERGGGFSAIKSADGKKVIVPNAAQGHHGEVFRGMTNSDGVMDSLSNGMLGHASMYREQTSGMKAYMPPKFDEQALKRHDSKEYHDAVAYFQNYAKLVNDHVGNSPIFQKYASGWSPDRIINWLETTAEGGRAVRQVKPESMPTGLWVDEALKRFDYYVPSKRVQRWLAKGRIKPSDLRKNVADEDLPTVYGPDLEFLDQRRGAGKWLKDQANKMYKALGGDPVDHYSRQPFFDSMYKMKMKSLVSSLDSKWLKPGDVERMTQESRVFAANEVKKTLYNLVEDTNFNDALRFLAPFWNAQYEAITKWLRIISDRPETVGRFFTSQRAVYNNLVVTDQDGKPVTSPYRPGGMEGTSLYHPNDQITFQMPKFISDKFLGGLIGSIRTPVGSANTILQGDQPLLPGLGPLVTVPADAFLRKVSKTYAVEDDQNPFYRWLFPIGRPRSNSSVGRVLEQLIPGYMKRIAQMSGPEDTLARINMEANMGREMILKAHREHKPTPTAEDISKAAGHMWKVRILAGLVSPVQTQFMPNHQYWLDAYHGMQRQYGVDAWDKFVAKYGEEAAVYAVSSSNSIGVPATARGMEDWSSNQKLIAKYPQWASAIVSPEAYMGAFSSDAYAQQFNITLGPGETQHLREGKGLQRQLVTEPEEKLGWAEWRKANAGLEAELNKRGLTTINARGAEDLVQWKRQEQAYLISKYPAWGKVYGQQGETIYSQVSELSQIAGNKMFDKRPDWLGVRQYLAIRQQVTQRLDAWGAQGGSRNLQASENGQLAQWFYGQVGQLVMDNPAFAEFYTRYLDQDTLTLGGGGY